MKKIEEARREIDVIDSEILALINRRAELAAEIGHRKRESAVSHYVPDRETKIINRLRSLNGGPLTGDAVEAVFREIISACRSQEGDLLVAYLGPEATYTHQAAVNRFGSSAVFVPYSTIRGVFSAVDGGKAAFGVVPIENSTEGGVGFTLDMLIEWDTKICGEVLLNISHCLLSLTGAKDDISRIYSHSQSFGQCREWLANFYPDIPLVEVASNAKAASLAADEKGSAAIAGALAGKIYNLHPVYEAIEDNPNNITRFFVISKKESVSPVNNKTSLVFALEDRAGSLSNVLYIFAKYRINLSKIESRPSKKKAWEYLFFVDLDGDLHNMRDLMDELKRETSFLKILGSYPSVVKKGQ